jgi:hypothetical protein
MLKSANIAALANGKIAAIPAWQAKVRAEKTFGTSIAKYQFKICL